MLPGEDSQTLVQVKPSSGDRSYNSNSLRDVGPRLVDDVAYSLRHIGLNSLRGSAGLRQAYLNTTFRPRNNKIGEGSQLDPPFPRAGPERLPESPEGLESDDWRPVPSRAFLRLCQSCSIEPAESEEGICLSCQENTRNRAVSLDDRQNLRFNRSSRPAAFWRAGVASIATDRVPP